MAEDLAELEEFLGKRLAALKPGRRKAIAGRIGRAIRKSNAARIAQNVDPLGRPFEKRKKRPIRKGRGRIKSKMFSRLKSTKSLKVRATADEIEIGFAGSAGAIARVHHYGLTGFVGRAASGKIVRAKYPERALLGFGAGDLAEIREAALDLLLGE